MFQEGSCLGAVVNEQREALEMIRSREKIYALGCIL